VLLLWVTPVIMRVCGCWEVPRLVRGGLIQSYQEDGPFGGVGVAGHFFGALLPGTAGSEAIRLQRLVGVPIAPGAMVTASPQGQDLVDWIAGQYARVRTES